MPLGLFQIPEGKYTYTIYSYIKDQKFQDVIKILNNELQMFPKSRAALSLLGYCYYQVQDFMSAANCYEQLVRYYPEIDNYKLYYAQSLQKSGQYQAALKACLNIENPELSQKVLKLQASIKYESNDLVGCKALIDDCSADDPDTMVNQACFLFKEKNTKKLAIYIQKL